MQRFWPHAVDAAWSWQCCHVSIPSRILGLPSRRFFWQQRWGPLLVHWWMQILQRSPRGPRCLVELHSSWKVPGKFLEPRLKQQVQVKQDKTTAVMKTRRKIKALQGERMMCQTQLDRQLLCASRSLSHPVPSSLVRGVPTVFSGTLFQMGWPSFVNCVAFIPTIPNLSTSCQEFALTSCGDNVGMVEDADAGLGLWPLSRSMTCYGCCGRMRSWRPCDDPSWATSKHHTVTVLWWWVLTPSRTCQLGTMLHLTWIQESIKSTPTRDVAWAPGSQGWYIWKVCAPISWQARVGELGWECPVHSTTFHVCSLTKWCASSMKPINSPRCKTMSCFEVGMCILFA